MLPFKELLVAAARAYDIEHCEPCDCDEPGCSILEMSKGADPEYWEPLGAFYGELLKNALGIHTHTLWPEGTTPGMVYARLEVGFGACQKVEAFRAFMPGDEPIAKYLIRLCVIEVAAKAHLSGIDCAQIISDREQL